MKGSERRLLASLAHPDDESFGLGGTLALYAAQGVEVHLICATRGDLGTVDPELLEGFSDVAELRQHELDCAARELGLSQVHKFGYRDSGMPGSPENRHPEALASAELDAVTRRVTGVIRRVRPQVIITFDPIGGYFHPDHIHMNRATRAAFDAAGDPDRWPDLGEPFRAQKLYFFTFSRRWLRLAVKIMPFLGIDPARWGRNQDIDLHMLAEHDFPIHTSIDITPALEIKQRASDCHASQHELASGENRLIRWLMRWGDHKESFTRAFPPAQDGTKEYDLFEGVTIHEGDHRASQPMD